MFNLKNKQPFDKDGQAHGEWIGYYPNDRIHYCCNFFHGVEHGLDKEYYGDGTLKYYGYWNMGRKVGYWYWFNQKRYYLWLI